MSTSRLFSRLGASIFRYNTNLFPLLPIRFAKLFPYTNPKVHLHASAFCCSAAVVDTVNAQSRVTASDALHPWPEWVAFVDRLKAKGYFVQVSPSLPPAVATDDEDSDGGEGKRSDGVVYQDMNLLKDACLRFARDRFDIFKLLSKQDIHTVVNVGCPNLFRKPVNSSKRLRVYVQLDEGDVCSTCTLRGSCDRAYVILKDSDSARTVDIVRVLLSYALDPLVISGGEKPPGREAVEVSVRNLLSELIHLSETTPSPGLPKPAANASQQNKQVSDFIDNEFTRDVKMKRGDWICPKCNFMNVAGNLRCYKCKEEGPKSVGSDFEMKKGDWVCTECNFINFARNLRCLKCKALGPKRVSSDDFGMKKGDWNCPQCGFMNFASNTKCLRCSEKRPKRQLNPGEWECPKCDFLNYRRNTVCLKCNFEHPAEVAGQYDDQIWTKPSY